MLEAVLQGPQPHSWIQLAAGKYSAAIEILDSKILPKGQVEHLFDIQVKPEKMQALLTDMRKDKDVIKMEVVKSDSGHIYGSAVSRRCTVCKQVAKSSCFLVSVGVVTDENARWTVLGSDDSYRGLVGALEKSKIPVEVKLRKTLEDTDLLTTRQEQILAIAFERGFYDFPKRVGLKELSVQFGIRASTLAEILRRGQKKVLGEYLSRRSLLHHRYE
jgi:predicted DNA binding protein